VTPLEPQHRLPRPVSEGGQALVEFVLGLPMLLMVLLVIVQFGMVMNDYVEVSQAARSGARKASVSRKAEAPATVAMAAARDSAFNLDQDDLDVAVTPEGSWLKGNPVSVRVSYPYKINVLGLVIQEGSMTFEATARVQ
jgi:Flp pilus assembly protein TadG